MENVAIYLRKSRAEELSDTVEDTLRRHKEILLEFAEKNDLQVTKIFEEVVSGDSLYARPQMLCLLSEIEKSSYTAVLCMDIDRLGRGAMSEQGIILETFKANKTKIITPRKIYDLCDEIDEEYTEFETFMARRELKLIKRRMQRGIRKTAEEGGFLATPPFGYERVYREKLPSLQIKENEANIVRIIFDLYVNHGMGCQKIAETINQMGIRPRKSASFCRTSIQKIICNPVYLGKIVWNQKKHLRKKSKSGNNYQNIIVPNPTKEWIIADGLHPPIISPEIFERAQQILKSRYHPPCAHNTLQNPLAGLIYCSQCGCLMQRQVMRQCPEGYLICPSHGCVPGTQLTLIEQAILTAIEPIFSKLFLKQKPIPNKINKDYTKTLSTLQRDISLLKEQQNHLYTLLEQGIYSGELYRQRSLFLQERITTLQKNIEELKTHFAKDSCPKNTLLKSSVSILSLYSSLTPVAKNLLLKSIIRDISYSKKKGNKPNEFCLTIQLYPFYL